MKSLEELQMIRNLLLKHAEELEKSIKNINNQYKRNIKIERKKILKSISTDYNLDYDDLIKKYINKETIEEKLLEITEIKGKEYFYENMNNGKIYNDENKIVGTYKNNNFILNC